METTENPTPTTTQPTVTTPQPTTSAPRKERRMLFGLDDAHQLRAKRGREYVVTKNPTKALIFDTHLGQAKQARADLEPRKEGPVYPVTVSKRSHYVYVAMHKPKANRKMVRTSKLSDAEYEALVEEWNQ